MYDRHCGLFTGFLTFARAFRSVVWANDCSHSKSEVLHGASGE